MISVLLSAYNEEENAYFWETLSRIEKLRQQGFVIEAIVGATPGRDKTISRLLDLNISVVEIETSMRAERYNAAFKKIRFKEDHYVLLHHPRSLLNNEGYTQLLSLDQGLKWGAFTHRFDLSHPLLRFTSWWSNQVRGDLKHIFYLDHCLFVKHSLLQEIGGVPAFEVFEDTQLCLKLRERSRPRRLEAISTTSAIRFQKKGIWAQALQNQILKLKFFCGLSHIQMNKAYEKDQNLNC
jgi:hypothetical protein